MNYRHKKLAPFWCRLGCAAGAMTLVNFRSAGADLPDALGTDIGSTPIDMKLGPFDFQPRVGSEAYYDNNILFSSTNRESDLVWQLQPGIQATAGDKLTLLSYKDAGWDIMQITPDSLVALPPEDWTGRFLVVDDSPQFKWFTDHPVNNYIGNIGQINTVLPGTKYILGASFDYDDQSIVAIEGLQYTGKRTIEGTLSGAYFFSDKTSLDTTLVYEGVDYEQLERQAQSIIGYDEYRDETWLNYQWSEPLNFSAGLIGGVNEVAGNEGDQYVQALLRARYQYAAKLSFNASMGGEYRQYDSGIASTYEPVFDVGVRYDLLKRTSFQLSGRRTISATVFEGYNYSLTVGTLEVSQGLTDRITGVLDASYGTYDFTLARANSGSSSSDISENYYAIRADITVHISHEWTGEIYYTYSDISQSTVTDVGDNKFGLELTWKL